MSGLSRKENGWWRGAVALTDLSTTRLRFWLVLTTVTWCQLPSETLRSANRVTLVWRQLTGKEARYTLCCLIVNTGLHSILSNRDSNVRTLVLSPIFSEFRLDPGP